VPILNLGEQNNKEESASLEVPINLMNVCNKKTKVSEKLKITTSNITAALNQTPTKKTPSYAERKKLIIREQLINNTNTDPAGLCGEKVKIKRATLLAHRPLNKLEEQTSTPANGNFDFETGTALSFVPSAERKEGLLNNDYKLAEITLFPGGRNITD
jgi:hypothetical protein